MDVKNIKTYLTRKHNAWIKSIDDPKLAREVDSNSLIAGGAIASLVQGEEPNDIDIYLSDREVALKLVVYYIKKWNNDKRHHSEIGIRVKGNWDTKKEYKRALSHRSTESLVCLVLDLGLYDEDEEDKCLDHLSHEELVNILAEDMSDEAMNRNYNIVVKDKELDELTVDQLYLLNEYANGVSLFIRSSGVARDEKEALADEGLPQSAGLTGSEKSAQEEDEKPDYRPVFLTDNAISLKGKVQVILRFIGTPEEIIENFDYVHCTCTYVPSTRALSLPSEALVSMMTKNLVYVGSRFPICSLFRMRKFLARGYHINVGQILKMVFQVNSLDLNNLAVLEDQLLGVDTLYMQAFVKALQAQAIKQGDEFEFESYVTNLISEMFDTELSN